MLTNKPQSWETCVASCKVTPTDSPWTAVWTALSRLTDVRRRFAEGSSLLVMRSTRCRSVGLALLQDASKGASQVRRAMKQLAPPKEERRTVSTRSVQPPC